MYIIDYVSHGNALQHNATYCQHTPAHCNTLQYMHIIGNDSHGDALQHTATHCNTRQRTATHGYALQHTATRCTTLPYTAINAHYEQCCHLSSG